MNPTETFPHRCIGDVGDTGFYNRYCRCGKRPTKFEVALGTWGSNCPAALREKVRRAVAAERERDNAQSALREIRKVLEEGLSGWVEATTPIPDQPEAGPVPTLAEGVAALVADRDFAFARGAELEAVVKAARVLREDIRVIHEDDPSDIGLCPICGTAEHEVGCTVPALDEALASLQYEPLSARSAGGGGK